MGVGFHGSYTVIVPLFQALMTGTAFAPLVPEVVVGVVGDA